ncbi:cytochrome P450 [Mycena leptocephala]|nr:cytochrome P450 [Mycena leptocephala]
MLSSLLLQTLVAIVTAGFVLRCLLSPARKTRLPPGPRPLPLIGNILDVPAKQPWRTYYNWSQQYDSDILSLRLPGLNLVILNSANAIQELLVKRSLIYSDRPHSTMLGDLMGLSWVFAFMDYGDRWNEYRRLFHRAYVSEGVADSRAHELMAARRLLKRFLSSKGHYERELRLAAGDVILSVTYGISPASEEDVFVRLAEKAVGALATAALGGYLVDLYPPLRKIPSWLPGGAFKRKAATWKRLLDQMRVVPFEHAKSELVGDGVIDSCVTFPGTMLHSRRRALRQHRLHPGSLRAAEEEDVAQSVLGTAYIGEAAATPFFCFSVGIMCSFILAMALHPQIQKTAQNALDASLGGRLPDFSDYGHTPYIEALINEVLRWNPVAPVGIFHATSQDDAYRRYVILKGSVVVPNIWAVLHDPEVYGAHPERFRPERFLTPEGTLSPNVPDTDAAFGFGRRICPGRVMARNTLWITIASILATFDITDPVDAAGKPLTAEDNLEYTTSLSSHPPFFDCSFTPRSAVHEGLILSAME